ncbi:MAG TPA: TlpA disulfide reductase family protein [Anaeromyxobacteraceae bacterium]|nr:TlpA disulfide reductase family protein [Anaeromyxobacteraceae bacterium]
MRRILLAAALAISAGCAGERPLLARSWIIGRPLDLGVVNLAGEPVAVGGPDDHVRAVVLWATWCRSCFQLFPALDVLATGDAARGLAVHAISVDEDLEKVREALPRIPPRVRVLWDRGAERLGERLGVEELPTVLILDRHGVVRHVHEGADEDVVRQIDREVGRLLRER